MNIVDRVKNICLSPNTEWPVIESEPADTGTLVTGYVIPLSAIGAVAGFIGGSIVGSRWGIEGVAVAVLLAVFLNYAVLSYLCVRLLSIPFREFGRAHLPALWLGAWQLAVLCLALSFCREAGWRALLSLAASGGAMGLMSLAALYWAPGACRPKVFIWMARNLELQRFGAAGAWSRRLTEEHRLVYLVRADRVEFLRARYHY